MHPHLRGRTASDMMVYGVIGDPIAHSLSPAMFEAAFREVDMSAVYGAFPVASDQLELAIRGAKALGIGGFNVTSPHKRSILEFVDADENARATGAINTVTFARAGPTGTNTDLLAMRAVLDTLGEAPAMALVLGAGGAARAYTLALEEAGWELVIANRTFERAERLAEQRDGATPLDLDDVGDVLTEATLVLNATTVGLDDPSSAPIDTGDLGADHTVIDAIYRPRATRLISDARDRGARTITGDRLLLEQAVAAFERWFDEPVPRSAMNRALELALGRDVGV